MPGSGAIAAKRVSTDHLIVSQAQPGTVKPQAGPLIATQASRIARPETLSVTAPFPERDTFPPRTPRT